jgi:outer membrane lipoprotein SlyB
MKRAAAGLIACVLVAGPVLGQANVEQTIRYGTVVDMEKTTVVVKGSGGSGAQTGATVGAVAGYAAAKGGDEWLGALAGGALGAAVGRGAQNAARKKKGYQLIIKLEGTGQEIGVQVVGKKVDYGVGDRVRMFSGQGGQTEVRLAD